MNDKSELNRVYWHSRRGMLEVDLALMPFAEKVYPHLSAQDQALYCRLLESEDTDLFSWVLQKGRPADAGLASIMDKIIHYAKNPQSPLPGK